MTPTVDYRLYSRYPSRDIGHIPGDSGAPLIGDTLHFLRDLKGLTGEKYRDHGAVFRVNTFFQHTIVMLGPQANEAVLKDSAHYFSNALAWNPTLDRIFPNGLMLKDFDDHKHDRRVLQAAFRRPAMESCIETMSPQLAAAVHQWPAGDSFSFYLHVKELLLQTAASVFLGVDVGPESARLNRSFIDAVNATVAILKMNIPGSRWQKGQRGRRYLEEYVGSRIQSKQDSPDTDIFARICRARTEDGSGFSEQAIVDHLIFLLFAAHDTTTSTLCSIVYALAKNPQWQSVLRQEYAAMAGAETEFEALSRLEQTSLVFHEALRMYPPLPVIPRRCLRETEVLGYRIPRNAAVGLSPLFTHYMEEFWEDPQNFDPMRFAAPREENKRHFYQFIPFGGGAHKCLGLHFAETQAKLFLYYFLREFEVSVDPGYEMAYSVVPMSLPTDGLPVVLRRLGASARW